MIESGRGAGCVGGVDEWFTVAQDALGIWSIQGDAGKELGCHAASLAGIEMATRCASPGRLRFAKLGEEFAVLPHLLKSTFVADTARPELVVKHERTGVDIADRVDQADHPTSPAKVQTRQWLTEGRQMKERVAGEHFGPVQQPSVQLALLSIGGM